jgi:hypothetical protein
VEWFKVQAGLSSNPSTERERERKMNKMEEQVWFLMCRK